MISRFQSIYELQIASANDENFLSSHKIDIIVSKLLHTSQFIIIIPYSNKQTTTITTEEEKIETISAFSVIQFRVQINLLKHFSDQTYVCCCCLYRESCTTYYFPIFAYHI